MTTVRFLHRGAVVRAFHSRYLPIGIRSVCYVTHRMRYCNGSHFGGYSGLSSRLQCIWAGPRIRKSVGLPVVGIMG